MNIKDFDLNLLVVFDTVIKTRSLTVAGRELNRAQPTISHALGRLREACGDPLFVRVRNGLEPTALAQQLAGPISEALKLVQEGLSYSTLFHPETSHTAFTILMSDVGQVGLLPQLVKKMRETAPNVRLIATQLPREDYATAMEQGRASLAIGAIRELKGGFMQQRLFEDNYVCVVSAGNKQFSEQITFDQYVDGNHIGIISPGLSEIEVERLLLPAGRSRRIVVRVPHFLAALALLQGTDLIATIPSRVIRSFSHPEWLRTLELPLKIPNLSVCQYWHERAHQDPANRWLRGVISELLIDH